MRNKRFLFVLAGALVFGLLAAVSVSRYLSSAQAYTKNMDTVVVAKIGIPVGEKIVAEPAAAAALRLLLLPTEVAEIEKLRRRRSDDPDQQSSVRAKGCCPDPAS